jgi:hypothetical protein
MSAVPPPEAAHVVLPPLSGAEALLLVRILERATATLWRAHGDLMTEFLRTAPRKRARYEPITPTWCRAHSATAAIVPDESEISEQPQLAILATLKHAAASAICALRARHPELHNAVDPDWRPTTRELERAWSAMLAARRLCETLDAYGLELFPWSMEQDDDLPF